MRENGSEIKQGRNNEERENSPNTNTAEILACYKPREKSHNQCLPGENRGRSSNAGPAAQGPDTTVGM